MTSTSLQVFFGTMATLLVAAASTPCQVLTGISTARNMMQPLVEGLNNTILPEYFHTTKRQERLELAKSLLTLLVKRNKLMQSNLVQTDVDVILGALLDKMAIDSCRFLNNTVGLALNCSADLTDEDRNIKRYLNTITYTLQVKEDIPECQQDGFYTSIVKQKEYWDNINNRPELNEIFCSQLYLPQKQQYCH